MDKYTILLGEVFEILEDRGMVQRFSRASYSFSFYINHEPSYD